MNSSNVLYFVLFADDTTVYVQNDSNDSAVEILNTELAKVALWFDFNKLGTVPVKNIFIYYMFLCNYA